VIRNKKQKILLFFLMASFVVLSLAGCSPKQPERSPGKEQSQSKGQEKVPEELKEIKSSLEQLLGQLEQKKELQDNPEKLEQMMQQEAEGGQNNQQSQEGEETQGTNGQNQGGQGDGGGQQQGGQKRQVSPLKDWSQEVEQVTNLHQKWNGFEPKAVKAGMSQADVDGFKEKLDQLTVNIKAKNLQPSLLSVNEAYKYVPGFMEAYEQDNPPDLYRMKYQINQVVFNAEAADWLQSEDGIKQLEETWPKVRIKLRSQDAELTEKFEFGLKDLKRTAAKNDKELVKIKGKIVLDILKQMEEKLKQGQQGGGQGGQK
jgi:hypothetical protein